MHIGIFSRTYSRPDLEGVLDAIATHGVSHVHFNLRSAGVAALPDAIGADLCERIRGAFQARGMVMTSISGTFNAIHPDLAQRELDTVRACHLIERCRQMGTSLVTLCTGSRDPVDMWLRHADNDAPEAWADLLQTLSRLVPVAQANDVILGIEPETNNVVDSAAKARRLLNELGSPHLRIVFDGANLFDNPNAPGMGGVLTEAFDLLAPDIVMVHAKDLADPPAKPSQAAGKGNLDWETYCRLLKAYSYKGPVVLHNLSESEVEESVAFVRDHLANAIS